MTEINDSDADIQDSDIDPNADTDGPPKQSLKDFTLDKIYEAAEYRRQIATYSVALIAAVVFAYLIGRRNDNGFKLDTDPSIASKVLMEEMLKGFPARHQRDLAEIEIKYEQDLKAAKEAEEAGYPPRIVRRRRQRMFAITASKYEVTDEMTQLIADMDDETKALVDTVIFDQGKITDEGLKAICTLPNLQHLRLRLSPITDEGFKMLAGCKKLWFLNLPHCDCTIEGLEHLKDLPALRQLRLGPGRLDNEAPRAITKIGSLRGLHLIGVPVTNEGMKAIADMKSLESLYLDDSAVTEAGWDWLFENRPHLHVHVNQQHLDRDPQSHRHH